MANSAAPRSRNSLINTSSILPGQHDGADDGGQEDEGQGPERDQARPEDRVADLLGAGDDRVGGELGVAEGGDQDGADDAGAEKGNHHSDAPERVVQPAFPADAGAGEHG